ncbi:MAG: TSUP family transporter [Shimia sp.]|uniref:TSUP family transporter n=1 Tax=Shimia sp. TaxID=1954381 RepID=UPI00405A198F
MGGLPQALAFEGLAWVALAAFVAGIVRGFSGFGTALIYLPVAAQVMPPLWTILSLAAVDVIAPAVHIPSALRKGHPRDLMRLMGGVLLLLPVGLWVLMRVEPDVFRYAVSLLSLGMLVVLISWLRYRGTVTPSMVWGIGGAGGFLGGAAGVPGPPVILFYMASPHSASVVRANTTAYLYFYDLTLIGALLVLGGFDILAFVIGLALALPALAGNLLGAALFHPGRERLYRGVAYTIIAGAAISGLPILGGGG